MFKARRRSLPDGEADKLVAELGLRFDLIHLGELKAGLVRKEIRLSEEERLLREKLLGNGSRRPGALVQNGILWCRVWWTRARRGMLMERCSQLSLLEDEIRFAMRIRGYDLR